MGNGGKWDLARQLANVVGALFQVGMTAVASAAISEVTGERTPLIEPALYAFSIWSLIFALSLAYAGYQALPANRENPLLRNVGWFTAVAFACTGLWSVFVPERQLLLALAMLAVVFVCLTFVYRRVVDAASGRVLGRGERWLVALPVGVFLGWITAANLISLSSEVVRLGLVGSSGGAGEAVLGAALYRIRMYASEHERETRFGGVGVRTVGGSVPQGHRSGAAYPLAYGLADVAGRFDPGSGRDGGLFREVGEGDRTALRVGGGRRAR